MDYLKSNQSFSIFLSLVEAAGLNKNLSTPNFDGTLLLPDNSAITSQYSAEDVDQLLSDPVKVVKFVKNHILPG